MKTKLSTMNSTSKKRLAAAIYFVVITLLTLQRVWKSVDSKFSRIRFPMLSSDKRDIQEDREVNDNGAFGSRTQGTLGLLASTNYDKQQEALSNLGPVSSRQNHESSWITLPSYKNYPRVIAAVLPIKDLSRDISIDVNKSSYNSSTTLTRNECHTKYGSKSFLPLDQKKLPPIFYTFPGSGNTWGRLLIEHATGIFTGSVYSDRNLIKTLPGELTCDKRVSVVKVHPHTHSFDELNSGLFNSDNNKCNRGGIIRFERAVLLIRNPFDSIWSEYQRRVTQSHVIGVLKRGFDWSRWQANAASLSHQYHDMFTKHYQGVEQRYGVENTLYIKYENLKDMQTRVVELGKIAKFLGRPASDERLQCAFILSENEMAHRSIGDSDMNKTMAYTQPLVCRMWALLQSESTAHGYTVWGNMNCTVNKDGKSYPRIRRVNVGPQGEYDKRWVRPGKPLIDFGGHDDFDAEMKGQQQPTGPSSVSANNDSNNNYHNGNKQMGKSRRDKYHKQLKRKEMKVQLRKQPQQFVRGTYAHIVTKSAAAATTDNVPLPPATFDDQELVSKLQQQQQRQSMLMNAKGRMKLSSHSSSNRLGLSAIHKSSSSSGSSSSGSSNDNDNRGVTRSSSERDDASINSKSVEVTSLTTLKIASGSRSSVMSSSIGTTTNRKSIGGMSLRESLSIKGVGRVGENQAAWLS